MNKLEVQLRFPTNVWVALERALQHAEGPHESMAFGLVSSAVTARQRLLLVREIVMPPDDAFLPPDGHGARWKGAYTFELLNRALEQGLGLFIFHSHGNVRMVEMSPDDRHSASVLLPKFLQIAPHRPHGSIVLGQRCATGLLALPGRNDLTSGFTVRVFGEHMLTMPEIGASDDLLLLQRQPLVANPAFTHVLARTTVAVVGLSGGGSQVVPQLAALGVGTIVGIDPQRIDRGNAYASSRIGWIQVLLRRWKTSASRTSAWFANRRTRFIAVRARLPERAALEAIKGADIVVGCVNNMHARADIMELCSRYCIPYIDIGLSLSTAGRWASPEPPPISGIHGNVFVALPGDPCMWCTEFLTREKLDAETGGKGRSYLRDKHGDKDAWVLSFNGVLASQAASEVLQLLVGYAPDTIQRVYKRFDGFSGGMTECIVRRNAHCWMCTEVLASGDPLWT